MQPRAIALALGLLASAGAPAHAGIFEAPLDCVRPRLDLARGLCADPQLIALARETQASFDRAHVRLKAHPAVLETVVALNNDFVSSLRAFFDHDALNPAHALRRHRAFLDAVQPASGKNSLQGDWANPSVDLRISGGRKLSAKMRGWGFGNNAYVCDWETSVRPARVGWESDRGPKSDDVGLFYLRFRRQGEGLQVETPEQSERAPGDCPPWARFSGLFAPVSAKARLDRMPTWIIRADSGKTEKPKTIGDFLLLLPGRPFPEHAPDLTRDILFALLANKPVEGWTVARPKPDVIVIQSGAGADSVAFQFADADRETVEVIAFHKERWHLAEWRLRADRTTVFFAVLSVPRSVQRLFLTSRGGFRNGAPRDGAPVTDLTDDLRLHLERLGACRYFGVIRKAGPSLPQKEIDMNLASNKCGELAKLEAEIRERRARYPDALRVLDLGNQLAEE